MRNQVLFVEISSYPAEIYQESLLALKRTCSIAHLIVDAFFQWIVLAGSAVLKIMMNVSNNTLIDS